MASYSSRVKADIERWQASGLIDAATAGALARDVEKNVGRGYSFGSVLGFFAAALFGAAILLVIAANWEAFPRLLRVGMVFAVIAAGYLGGAILRLRGFGSWGEAAQVIAAAAFGSGIALIGQMYHLSGDEKQAVYVWCAGVAFAAALLRSSALNNFAVFILGFWTWSHGWEFWNRNETPHVAFLIMAAVLWALSLWTASRWSRYLLVLVLYGYLGLLYLDDWEMVWAIALAALGAVLFGVSSFQNGVMAERVLRIGGQGGMALGLVGFLAGITIVQFMLTDDPEFIVAAIVAFAGIIAAVMYGGIEMRVLRWLGYLAFAFEICFVYTVTLGTMLGTAGFFLGGGFVLALLAYVIRRIEKRAAVRAEIPGEPA